MKFLLLATIALMSSQVFAAPIHRVAKIQTAAGDFTVEIDVYQHTESGVISAASELSNPCEPCEDCSRCTTYVKHSGASIKATLKDAQGKVISITSQDSAFMSSFQNPIAADGSCAVAYPIGKMVGFNHPDEFMNFKLPGGSTTLAISIPMSGVVQFSPVSETLLNLDLASLTSVRWFLNQSQVSTGGIAILVDPSAPVPAEPPYEEYDHH